MVGPPHSRHPRWRRGALRRQCGVGAERSDRAMQQRARLEIRDEADEIADIRIREVQREGVALGGGSSLGKKTKRTVRAWCSWAKTRASSSTPATPLALSSAPGAP